jgi:hypothetical protein
MTYIVKKRCPSPLSDSLFSSCDGCIRIAYQGSRLFVEISNKGTHPSEMNTILGNISIHERQYLWYWINSDLPWILLDANVRLSCSSSFTPCIIWGDDRFSPKISLTLTSHHRELLFASDPRNILQRYFFLLVFISYFDCLIPSLPPFSFLFCTQGGNQRRPFSYWAHILTACERDCVFFLHLVYPNSVERPSKSMLYDSAVFFPHIFLDIEAFGQPELIA